MDKAVAQLEAIQTKREQAAKEAHAPYQPEAYFVTAPPVRESVFSTTEVARELNRDKLFSQAWDYGRPSFLRKKQALTQAAQASATKSPKEKTGPPINTG